MWLKRRETYPSIRMFESSFLEFFSHVHPSVIVVVWLPILAYFLWRSIEIHHHSLITIGFFAGLGILSWTLLEYVLHRFIFHFPVHNAWQQRLYFSIHGVHHDDPKDLTRLVMTPPISLTLGSGIYLALYLPLGSAWADPYFCFMGVGYLWYDLTHYAVHRFHPKTAWGRWAKKNHMLHHYSDSGVLWGVTTPLWDYIFGSIPPKKSSSDGMGT